MKDFNDINQDPALKIVIPVNDTIAKRNKTLATILVSFPILVLIIAIIEQDIKEIFVAVVSLMINLYFASQLRKNIKLSGWFTARMIFGILFAFGSIEKTKESVGIIGASIAAGIYVLFNVYFLIQINSKPYLSEKKFNLLDYVFLPTIFIPLLLIIFLMVIGISSDEAEDNSLSQNHEREFIAITDSLAIYNDSIKPHLKIVLTSDDSKAIKTNLENLIPILNQRRLLLDSAISVGSKYYAGLQEIKGVSSYNKSKFINNFLANYNYQKMQGEELDSMNRIWGMIFKTSVKQEKERLAITFASHYKSFKTIDSGLDATLNIMKKLAE